MPNETRYSAAFSRELLAIFLAIRHFPHLLESRDFTVHTDHKPQVYALKSSSDKYNLREISQLFDYISQFTPDVKYVKGSENLVADALFRAAVNSITSVNGMDMQ